MVPITNPTPDDGDPAVVAVLVGDAAVCTGSLIAPDLVLTAAHCVAGVAPTEIYFGTTPPDGGERVAVAGSVVHPAFNALTLDNDIGLVRLIHPVRVTPLTLLGSALDASLASATIRVAGFGAIDPNDMGPHEKHSGTSQITTLTATDFTLMPSPSQPCVGDSGGPAFLDRNGVDYLIGVTSAGDPDCALFARDIRVDAVATFVVPYLDEPAGSEITGGCAATRDDGVPVWFGLVLAGLASRRQVTARRRTQPSSRTRPR